jgi:acylphosphatase
MERKLFRILVTGRVQGVGYRWSAAREATRTGITGYVKNQGDGSVYIEAEGTEEKLNLFVAWCRIGPGIGHVDSIKVSEYPPAGYTDFRIDH